MRSRLAHIIDRALLRRAPAHRYHLTSCPNTAVALFVSKTSIIAHRVILNAQLQPSNAYKRAYLGARAVTIAQHHRVTNRAY